MVLKMIEFNLRFSERSIHMDQRIFENRVEVIRYQVLREMARHAWEGHDAFTAFNEISNVVAKKGEPPMSCCIYKDR